MRRRAPSRTAPTRPQDLAYAVSLAEAARLLGVCPRTVHRIIASGYLQPFFLPHSGRPRLPLDQVLAIRKQTTRPPRRYTSLRRGRRR